VIAYWKAEALAELQNIEWTKWGVRYNLLLKLPLRLRQEFAIICAEKALPAWEAAYPQDGRPKAAIAAAKAFLRGEISAEECREAAQAASAAARAAYYGASVAYAARAASAAAAAAAAGRAALAADAAYAAGHASIGGWDWQVPLLTDLITNWED